MTITFRRARLALMSALLLAGCASAHAPEPADRSASAAMTAPALKAVLVAGDDSLPVWDNATARMDRLLLTRAGMPADAVRMLSARDAAVRAGQDSATVVNVLRAIAAMNARGGQQCLVYVTAHGAQDEGLYMAASDQMLAPDLLDQALERGCGDAPTVVILSGCYAGLYLNDPMPRPNRLILTAAREDRTSFGCGAGFEYTVFDQCLLESLTDAAPGTTWATVFTATRSCVARNEVDQDAVPSEPQSFAGPPVAALRVPWRAAVAGN
jgi:hypothetical protein